MKETILVTTALPYLNGPLHLGHILEAIQADIFVREYRERGYDVCFISGGDSHGTPIELSASKLNLPPEEYTKQILEEHKETFKKFDISFTKYGVTNSEENKKKVYEIFETLKKNNCIVEKYTTQLFSESLNRFLADRYVKGTCPKCSAKDQYGDTCESCNAHYDATELVDPYCPLDNKNLSIKETKQLYVAFEPKLKELESIITSTDFLSLEIRNSVKMWIKGGLNPWEISRDAPYLGFEIPGFPGKYFYVWFDAPIAYISISEELYDWKEFDWSSKIFQFIGKDIVNFHALFWLNILLNTNYNIPEKLHVHGMLTFEGKKLSKSKGTLITASKYLENLNPDFLRFYFASKLTNSAQDIDFSIKDFYSSVNGNLIDNICNLHYRVFSFAQNKLDGYLSDFVDEELGTLSPLNIMENYEKLRYSENIKAVCELSSKANKYFQEKAPWKSKESINIISNCVEVIRLIAIYLKPVLPYFSESVFRQLNLPSQSYKDIPNRISIRNRISNVVKIYTKSDLINFENLIKI